MAIPEHQPYRGIDIGTCKGQMIPLYSEEDIQKVKKPKMSYIKSVGTTNQEVIQNIMDLHIKSDRFDLDPCFSLGKFYRGLQEPILKFDINPQRGDVRYANSTKLPLLDESINSIMFDPPFIFGRHGGLGTKVMEQRFGSFESFEHLRKMYQESLVEFHRILIKKGILVFKCQDLTDSKTTMTHCLVYQWATETDFYVKDLFILTSTNRIIYKPNSIQRHARKFHSYFWIIQKK